MVADLLSQIRESPIKGNSSLSRIQSKLVHLHSSLPDITSRGIFAEFGVAGGMTINAIARAIRPRIVFGFDSFLGLPEPWLHLNEGCFNMGGEPPKVDDNVELKVGMFKDTIPAFAKGPFAPFCFMNMDADLYESTFDVLCLLDSKIVPGTVIRFDELFPWDFEFEDKPDWLRHEYRALLDWMRRYDRSVVPVVREHYQSATVRVTR